MVAWLLAAGADLDVRDDNGCTALHLSCLRAEPTIAATCTRQLLAAGAEADGLTASGMVRLSESGTPRPRRKACDRKLHDIGTARRQAGRDDKLGGFQGGVARRRHGGAAATCGAPERLGCSSRAQENGPAPNVLTRGGVDSQEAWTAGCGAARCVVNGRVSTCGQGGDLERLGLGVRLVHVAVAPRPHEQP